MKTFKLIAIATAAALPALAAYAISNPASLYQTAELSVEERGTNIAELSVEERGVNIAELSVEERGTRHR